MRSASLRLLPRKLTCRNLAYRLLALAQLWHMLCLVPTPVSAEVIQRSIRSNILGRDYFFSVYLPAGWRSSSDLPVLYLLHGAGGDDTTWVRNGRVDTIAEELIQSHQVPPHIIVMPEMLDCWWVNSKICKFEDFFWQELDPAIALMFPVSTRRKDRLIGGISAGGFGAISLALSHPESFIAAIALSPAIYTHEPPAFSQLRTRSPFIARGGKFDESSWNAANYPSRLAGYALQKDRVAFYLSSGNQDRYGLTSEVIKFYEAIMRVDGQTSEVHITNGGHDWDYWRCIVGPALGAAFKFRSVNTISVIAVVPGADPLQSISAMGLAGSRRW